MEKLTAAEIAKMTGGKIVCGNELTECVAAEIDSRRVTPHCVFFAIKGQTTDGHLYIDSAIEKGAEIIVIERPLSELSLKNAENAVFIEVISSERALGALALAYRSRYEIPFVGVTGSVGKTTTKEMIYAVLSAKYNVLKSEGNYNSETGLPLSVLNLTKKHTASVLEMGMDAAGEIDYLTRIAKPAVAVITNIGVSHIETLGSRKNILKAKLEIENGLGADGTLVLNADDDMLFGVAGSLSHPIIYYGIENPCAGYRAENIRYLADKTVFTVVTPYESFEAEIKAFGKHNVLNALAAAVAGYLTGLTTAEIIKGLSNFVGEKMRQSIYEINGVTVMEDCYNASPDSMRAAFDVIKRRNEKRKTAILADMLELGEKSPEYHFKTGVEAAKVFDTVICYGEMAKNTVNGANSVKQGCAFHCESSEQAAKMLIEKSQKGDIILFKASRGMKAEECIAKFKEGWKE
ncbi:MAG: UDP-N-acetylmuramoyl-tripeptide--D-alanyl-D-alanine ligase [Clostridia bacterium]|nr:UDP-N-acetylmuramoyl-tripeptide--D-alanyl-D-alanine ligase [Clostridia bacterium]